MTKFQIFRGHKLSPSVCFDKICEHTFSYVTTVKDINTEKSNCKTLKPLIDIGIDIHIVRNFWTQNFWNKFFENFGGHKLSQMVVIKKFR